jgi:hypothetical protein
MTSNRRDLLKLAAASTAYLAGGGAAEAEIAHATPVPADVGRKFFANGRVRPFAGNTIICHAPQQGDNAGYFNALLDIYRDAVVLPYAKKIALTPPSSYHVTIFGGANDQERRPGLWPKAVPLDAGMTACNAWVAQKLKALSLDCALPLRFKIDLDPPHEAPFVLRLLPVDAQEDAKLRRLIARLSATLGITPPGIDTYQFHTTLGYSLQWLDDNEDRDFQGRMTAWRGAINRQCPEIPFGAPEYCLLDDMYAFHRQFYLT